MHEQRLTRCALRAATKLTRTSCKMKEMPFQIANRTMLRKDAMIRNRISRAHENGIEEAELTRIARNALWGLRINSMRGPYLFMAAITLLTFTNCSKSKDRESALMTTMPPNNGKEKVIREIENAFSGNTYPGDSKIVLPSKFEYDTEREGIRDYFTGRKWKQCSVKDREWFNNTSWCVLTREAFQYYLPAFLIASIRDYSEADLIPSSIVNCLTPPRPNVSTQARLDFDARVAFLNESQKRAIKTFLLFMRESHPDVYMTKDVERAIKFYSED